MESALADKALMAPFVENGSIPLSGMAEDKFKAFIADEMRKWAEVVRASGATLN